MAITVFQYRLCPHCYHSVSWTLKLPAGGFIGNAKLLYHYGKLLLLDCRYPYPELPDIWGCDRCEMAGLIPAQDVVSDNSISETPQIGVVISDPKSSS